MDEQDVKDNDNNQQEQSGNMYSYRNDNVNIKQSEAIRRSLGEGNPSGYPQNKFGSNPNNFNILNFNYYNKAHKIKNLIILFI